MSILLVIGIFAFGSLAAVALVALLFGVPAPMVGGVEVAAEKLARDVPGFVLGASAASADGRAALIEDAAHRTSYVVVAVGDERVVRRLSPDLACRIVRDGATLELALAEFALPRVTVKLGDERLARTWECALRSGHAIAQPS